MLDEMLAGLRLSGGVFVEARFCAPWSFFSHFSPEDCTPFFPMPDQLIAYHYVIDGEMSCALTDGTEVHVSAGDIVLLPQNVPHFLHGAERMRMPLDGHELIRHVTPEGRLSVRGGGNGAVTEMFCGYLGTSTPDNMLLQSLPAVLTIGTGDLPQRWVAQALDFAARGIGVNSPEMVGKLAEGLFAEAVRRYVASLPSDGCGWLAALRDPAIGRALTMIHRRYAEPWTLEALAREAGVSKTVLVERFRELIGEPPMQYCARWRMRVAAEMLRDARENASSVAYSVGFNSEAAFNRAFKREFGAPPAAWRRARAA